MRGPGSRGALAAAVIVVLAGCGLSADVLGAAGNADGAGKAAQTELAAVVRQ